MQRGHERIFISPRPWLSLHVSRALQLPLITQQPITLVRTKTAPIGIESRSAASDQPLGFTLEPIKYACEPIRYHRGLAWLAMVPMHRFTFNNQYVMPDFSDPDTLPIARLATSGRVPTLF